MMTFRRGLSDFKVPMSSVGLVNDVAEGKGRQNLYNKRSPLVLKALRELALLESVESSSRLEGVTVSPDRMRPLVLGNARPRDRSEEEIRGYLDALQRIHGAAAILPVSPDTLRDLHRTIHEGAGDAGQWKAVANDIVEFRAGPAPTERFRPVSVAKTPAAVKELCRLYSRALDQQDLPPLVATACLVLDFLCIQPFRDGNGRLSRLLTVLALYHHDFQVGRYISLERLIEESKEEYHAVLQASSAGWREGKHDLLPWLNYFLAVVRRAYLQFEERAERVWSPKGAKTAIVQAAVQAAVGPFTIVELERSCPGVSREMIRFVLRTLRKQGKVECQVRGPVAFWRNKGITPKKGQS